MTAEKSAYFMGIVVGILISGSTYGIVTKAIDEHNRLATPIGPGDLVRHRLYDLRGLILTDGRVLIDSQGSMTVNGSKTWVENTDLVAWERE